MVRVTELVHALLTEVGSRTHRRAVDSRAEVCKLFSIRGKLLSALVGAFRLA
jgi:hypothetical protein